MNQVRESIAKLTGVIVVISVIGLFLFISNKQGEFASEVSEAESKLASSKDNYVRCFNTVNYGSVKTTDVKLDYLQWNSTDEEKQQLNNIEKSFLEEAVEKCGNSVVDYESTYQELVSLDKDLSDDWYAFLMGGSTAHVDIDQYNPGLVRMTTGEVFNYYTFTEEDIQQYFKDRL